MAVSLSRLAGIIKDMGYETKFVSGTNRTSGEHYDVVEIATGRRVDASLKLTKGKLSFETWGRFPEGHGGRDKTESAKFNRSQAAQVRAKLEPVVVAAVALELSGGSFDMKDLAGAFGLDGREITPKRAAADGDDLDGEDEPKQAPLVGSRAKAAPGM